MVVIQSTYHEFGAGVVAADTGVLLQNRGASFSLDPTHPNCLAPRKRPAHTLIPSMYLVGGRPRLVYGTMGGDGQPQTQAALLTRMVVHGLSPQAAVGAPRWLYGRTWGERSTALWLEGRFGEAVAAALQGRGHDVRVVEDWSDLMGHAQVIRLDADGLTGGSDPRPTGRRWAGSRYRGPATLVWVISGSLLVTMAAPATSARSAPRHPKVATIVHTRAMPRQGARGMPVASA